MTSNPFPAAVSKRIIDRAWWDLVRACESNFRNDLQDVLELEMKEERGHRRMGARFTNGSAQYRLSAEYAAKLFVVRHVVEAPQSVDLADLGRLRPAVTQCYILAARMRKTHQQVTKPDAPNPTLWEKFMSLVQTSQFHHATPTAQVGGTIRNMRTCAAQKEMLRRCEYAATFDDKSLTLDSPLVMSLDYAVDIAVH